MKTSLIFAAAILALPMAAPAQTEMAQSEVSQTEMADATGGRGDHERAHQRAPATQLMVTGAAQMSAVPDQAILSIGIREEAKAAVDASRATNETMAAIIDALRAMKIPESAMQTEGLYLGQNHENYGSGSKSGGFEARNGLNVRLDNPDQAGAAIDAAIGAGANEIRGLTFTLAEPGPLADQVRAAAVIDARQRADVLAAAAGMKVKRIVSIVEGQSDMNVPMMAMVERAAGAAATPVMAGESTVNSRVTMTVSLVPLKPAQQ